MSVATPHDIEPRIDRVVSRTNGGSAIQVGLRHEHREFELSWVESGYIHLASGPHRRPIEISDGACILLPPNFEVTPSTSAAKIHQVAISPSALEDAAGLIGRDVDTLRKPRIIAGDSRLSRLIGIFVQEAGGGPITQTPLVASLWDAVVHGLVKDADDEDNSLHTVDRRLRLSLAAMEEGYGERLTVDDLAEAAGMSRFSFLRTFKAQFGVSPYHYLTALRLQRAADQLRAPGRPSVLNVALACGFGDPGRFAHSFRMRFGCSPRAYRARYMAHTTPGTTARTPSLARE